MRVWIGMLAAVMLAGGAMAAEQQLTPEIIKKVREGMRQEEVRALLGPPSKESPLPRQQLVVWEYPWLAGNREHRILWVHFSTDGVVRKVVEQQDYAREPSE